MEQLTDEENDSPPVHFEDNTSQGTRIPTPSDSSLNIEFQSPLLLPLEQQQESNPNFVMSNSWSLSSSSSLNSIDNGRIHWFSTQEEPVSSSTHSAETYLQSEQNPEWLWNQRHLFLVQRQMVLDMGLLFNQNELEQFSCMDNPEIDTIPTRPIDYSRAVPTQNAPNRGSNRFVIFKQPDSIQRRSYSKEKRFLTPKPIVICAKDTIHDSDSNALPKIIQGTVSADLAFYEKNKNIDDLKYIPHLLKTSDGVKTKKLVENTAEFEITVMGISGANKYVLVFRIEYKLEGGEIMEETLVSSPFQVVANANKLKPHQGNCLYGFFRWCGVRYCVRYRPVTSPTENQKTPTVEGLLPKEGPCDSETEVWIKGSDFTPQGTHSISHLTVTVEVMFSQRQAKVISVEDNLVTVIAPMFPKMKQETEVSVSVKNLIKGEIYPAETKLKFTYFTGDKITRLRNASNWNHKQENKV